MALSATPMGGGSGTFAVRGTMRAMPHRTDPPLTASAAPACVPLAVPDWRQPWFQPLMPAAARVWQDWRAGTPVADALQRAAAAAPGCPVGFAAPACLPSGEPYERFVRTQACVPTRDNAHDLFNGLVWLHWPRSKQALNALQAAEIARRGVGATRGPVRDAITLLDENGALLAAPEPLWQALRARQWGALFGPLRPLWAQARLWVLGHAALEKLVTPYKSITVHVLPAPAGLASVAEADAWLAGWLGPERLVPKPFAPLPVLGVPGWWAGNQAPDFYDDAEVFRPARRALPEKPE